MDSIFITCGVLQVLVLGPVLFSFYILPSLGSTWSFNNISYHFYADDDRLYNSFRPHHLSNLDDYLSNNYLVLNSNKTEMTIIAPPELDPNIKRLLPSVHLLYKAFMILV